MINYKTISFIGTVGVPACYGGFESLIDNILDYPQDNIQYTVFCSAKAYKTQLKSYKDAKLIYINIDANSFGSIFYDFFSMLKSIKSDVVVILGVSGCIFLPLFRLMYRGKIITNIDGLEWKRDKWRWYASLFLRLSEWCAVKFSHFIIGDNKGITDYVQKYFKKNAILIEYGSDHAVYVEKEKYLNEFPFVNKKYTITVCRIEPENNIHAIIEAFLSGKSPLYLVIVGNWQKNGYSLNLFNQYNKKENIILLDPIYDVEKINYIRSHASLYLHGHSAGGTNPSLVEAMNLGLPILAYDCIYNRETTENHALFWKNQSELTNLLNNHEIDFNTIGYNLKQIAKKRYQWSIIANKYHELF